MKNKKRLDVLLVEQMYAETRSKAQAIIMAGLDYVNGQKADKAGMSFDADTAQIEVRGQACPYVSRGGLKLEKALRYFGVKPEGYVCSDSGASTGGFTDCLLQNGAKKIYAVDVGESLLHERLANDSRIIKMDNTNARYLTKSEFPERIDGVTIDVSFISLKLILSAIKEILGAEGDGLLLIKPQFECEKKNIGKSGIVHPSSHSKIVKSIVDFCLEIGLFPVEIINAPIRKGKNIEYVLHVKPTETGKVSSLVIENAVKEFVKLNSLGELK